MANTISTIAHLLDALGGDAEISNKYGISKSSVAMWRVRNHISNAFHLRFWAEAKRRGLNVCPSVFGLEPEEAEGLFDHETSSFKKREIQQNVV